MPDLGQTINDPLGTYLETIANIRNSLIGSDTQNKIKQNEETIKYYLKVKELGLLYIGGTLVRNVASVLATKTYYKKIDLKRSTSNILSGDTKRNKGTNLFKTNNGNVNTNSAFDSVNIFPVDNQPVYSQGIPSGPTTGEASKVTAGESFNELTSYTIPGGNGKTLKFYKSWVKLNGDPSNETSTLKEPLTQKIAQILENGRNSVPYGSYKFFIEKLHGKSAKGDAYKKGNIEKGKTRTELPNRMVFPAYISSISDSYSNEWGNYKFIGRGEKSYAYESTERSFNLEFTLISDFSAELLVTMSKALKTQGTSSSTNTNAQGSVGNGGGTSTNGSKPGIGGIGPNPNPSEKAFDKTSTGDSFTSSNNSNYDINKPFVDPTYEETIKEIQTLWADWGTGITPDGSYINNQRFDLRGKYTGTPELMWLRHTFLTQCMYPYYRKDGKMKEQPIIRLRIGDFYDLTCIIKSLDFSPVEELDLDVNPSVLGNIPMMMKVAMNLTVIHEEEPHSEYYKFYHRQDFDNPDTKDKKPDVLSETSIGDAALDNNRTGSPLFSVSKLNSTGSGSSIPKDTLAVQEALSASTAALSLLNPNSLGSNSIQQKYQNFNDMKKNEKLKDALKASMRSLDVLNRYNLLQLPNIAPVTKIEQTGLSKLTDTIPQQIKNQAVNPVINPALSSDNSLFGKYKK